MHKITKWLKSFLKDNSSENLDGVDFALCEPNYRPSMLCPDEHTKWFKEQTLSPYIIRKHISFDGVETEVTSKEIDEAVTQTFNINKKKWWQFWK